MKSIDELKSKQEDYLLEETREKYYENKYKRGKHS